MAYSSFAVCKIKDEQLLKGNDGKWYNKQEYSNLTSRIDGQSFALLTDKLKVEGYSAVVDVAQLWLNAHVV